MEGETEEVCVRVRSASLDRQLFFQLQTVSGSAISTSLEFTYNYSVAQPLYNLRLIKYNW